MEKLIGLKKAIFYISFPFSFIGFILPIYASNMGASPLEVGILYSVFSLSSILIRPFIGKWIDNRGRKSGVIIGLLAYTLVMTLFFIGNNYTYIFIARILQSIASSFLWISVYTMIADISKDDNMSRSIGIIDQVENKGLMIGSIIGFTVLFNRLSESPFKVIFSIYLITSLIALYYGFFKIPETLDKDNNLFTNESKISGRFIKFLILIGILTLIQSMLSPIYLIYLKEHITKDLALISFLYVPGALLSLFLPKRFGSLSDKHGRINILVIGIIIQGLFATVVPLLNNYFWVMLMFTFVSIGQMLGYTAKIALVTELTDGIKRGRNYGLYHLAIGLSGTIGPLLGTYIYQEINKKLVFYLYGIALIAISILISVVFKKRRILGTYDGLSANK